MITYNGKEFANVRAFRSWLFEQPLEYKDSHVDIAGKRQWVDNVEMSKLRISMIDSIIKETCSIEWEGKTFDSKDELYTHLLKLPMQYRNCNASIGEKVIRVDLSDTRMKIIHSIMEKYDN